MSNGIITSKRQAGFTLMELLMVIMLLVILMAAGITNWLAQIKKAHDAERKSDLHKIQIMLEHYLSNNNEYPPQALLNDPAICGSRSFEKLELQVYPCDPESKEPYLYIPNASQTGFKLYARLTVKDDVDIAKLGCTGGCPNATDSTYNYGVSSDGIL